MMSEAPLSLVNHLLIAMPQMEDTFFHGSVVYLCEHTENGAVGLVINKISPLPMSVLFERADLPVPPRYQERGILLGGPVQADRGFILHTPVGDWENSLVVSDTIALTTSRDIVEGMLRDEVGHALAAVGYASWSAGQLEQELATNAWLTVPAREDVIFEQPITHRYEAAMELLGFDLLQLGDGRAGNA